MFSVGKASVGRQEVHVRKRDEQQTGAIINLENAGLGSRLKELAVFGQETTQRTPGDALAKREGRICYSHPQGSRRARMDLTYNKGCSA